MPPLSFSSGVSGGPSNRGSGISPVVGSAPRGLTKSSSLYDGRHPRRLTYPLTPSP